MNDYERRIKKDLPQQFRDRERINGLIEVISEQFQEIADFYETLKIRRFLFNAQGTQLDRIGSILVLSRREAMDFLGIGELPDDDQYRIALQYKAKLNFAEGTYEDIIDQLKIINGDSLGFKFREQPEYPAMVIFETPKKPNASEVMKMVNTPVKLAGGVGRIIRSNDGSEINIQVGVAAQTREERSVSMDESTIKDIVCFADEDNLMYTDWSNNLYIQ